MKTLPPWRDKEPEWYQLPIHEITLEKANKIAKRAAKKPKAILYIALSIGLRTLAEEHHLEYKR